MVQSASLKVVFMGSPAFVVPVAEVLRASTHTLAAVYTREPDAAGRGMKVRPCPMHEWALAQGIPVFTPKSLKKAEAQAELAALQPDVIVVAAYGLILPQVVLDIPRYGCINIHPSLLPRWRGATPIQRPIQAGDAETGVCVMQMGAGLDDGPVWDVRRVPITPTTTAGELHDSLFKLGADMLLPVIDRAVRGDAPTLQTDDGVTYAEKIDKAEAVIDFNKSAIEIDRHIRAFTPWPGAFFIARDVRVKVHHAVIAQPLSTHQAPGTLLDDDGLVACGNNTALRLLTLQREGRQATDAPSFLRGFGVKTGEVL
jgi:methionyl-tRNA formyltransferase